MKELRNLSGPFPRRLFFTAEEIDQICSDSLRSVGLLPETPAAIRIERFLEKYFNVTPSYESLGPGILGGTVFSNKGRVLAVLISSRLVDEEDIRLNSTLAHEAGHGLLHASLFLDEQQGNLFGKPAEAPKIMCRESEVHPVSVRAYDGRWWEWQANRAISGLLLPKRLVAQSLGDLLVDSSITHYLPATNLPHAVKRISEVFAVSRAVSRIRLEEFAELRTNLL